MKRQLFKILLVIVLMLGLNPSNVSADTTDTTYTVTVTAKHGNQKLSYVNVMVEQNDETITYKTTNKNGVATFELTNGTYTVIVDYTSGNYSYYGKTEFTVNNQNTSVNINIDSEFSKVAATAIYDKTTYFDHVDIRVNGFYTTGTDGNTTTNKITLKNVKLLVTDGDKTLINTTFKDENETYEWRVTNVQIPKTAKVSLIADILINGKTVKENYTHTFEGKDDFVQAIINCDQNQGLDFIIEAEEIKEAIEESTYQVSYEWQVFDTNNDLVTGNLPTELQNLPATTKNYTKGSPHTIDSKWQKDYSVSVKDSTKNKIYVYVFSGWINYRNATDSLNDATTIENNQTNITINNDTIVYGYWTVTEFDNPYNYLTITKTFDFGNSNGQVPKNLYFTVTDENNHTIEISYEAFVNGTYNLPVYESGTYTITEHNPQIEGFTFTGVNINGNPSSTKSITINIEIPQLITTTDTIVATVSFENSYTENSGKDIYNSFILIEKADALDGGSLEGAIFILTDEEGNVIEESMPTNESGDVIFKNLHIGTYYITETTAPEGYYKDDTSYKVIVSLPEGYIPTKIYDESQDAYVLYYDGYIIEITPNEHYNEVLNRLTVYNEKITGSLTISKNFGKDSVIDEDNIPPTTEVNVIVSGDNYEEIVTLNKNNNWTVTLNNLELGDYTISEIISDATIYGYNLNINYQNDDNETKKSIKVTLDEDNTEKTVVITNTYTYSLNGVPNTSDNSNLGLYCLITLLSIVGLIITITNYRTRQND